MLNILRKPVELFTTEHKFDFMLFGIWLTINLLTGINTYLQSPLVGYDAGAHLDYAAVLTQRLPTPQDTYEYFSAPLPYLIPSWAYRVCAGSTPGADCRFFGGRIAQLINFILSLGITLLFISIGDLLQPGNRHFKISALAMLGLLTVYYKTFSQVRGEPYVAFFVVLIIHAVLGMLRSERILWWKHGALLGIPLGLLILSRQWGFFMFPAIGGLIALAWIQKEMHTRALTLAVLCGLVVALVVGGWFYIYLYQEYGSYTAYVRQTKGFAFSNQPLSFYRDTGLGDLLLFRAPTRPVFDNQFMPVFYSETWGDYWGYFVFLRDKSYPGGLGFTNQDEINPYLGRVNAVSLFPTAILLGGLALGLVSLFRVFGRRAGLTELMHAFLFLFVLFSLAGYLWYLISYPVPQGVNIKPTYMIQIFMALPFLSAALLEKIRARHTRSYWVCLALLLVVFLHNLPAMISRYTIFLVTGGS